MNYIILIIIVILSVAFLTLFERKILSYIQNRKGPNKLLFKGLLQPFSDILKLIFKEIFYLRLNKIFYYSPILIFFVSSILWLIYPWIYLNLNIIYNIVFLLFVIRLNVYPILIVRWVSINNYSILGIIRLISQIISFEVLIFLIFFIIIIITENFKFINIIFYQLNLKFFILIYPLYFIFIISLLIDLNRIPFDLIEGESELVSGFNLEYYRSLFVYIFLSEYINLLFISMILLIIFYGFNYWSILFNLFLLINLFFLVMIRGVLCRIRYDYLIYICWIELLVLILYYLIYLYFIKELINLINF